MRQPPDKITRWIQKNAGLRRFLLVGETNDGNVTVICWNGREYQNQIDLIGLIALAARPLERPSDAEIAREKK